MAALLIIQFFFFFVRTTFSNPLLLSPDYYSKTCPNLLSTIQQIITDKQQTNPSTAAATLRLFFHDCMLGGCDASLLISSTPFSPAQRDSEINLSLPGDAFDLILRAKSAIELLCPSTVSCADILSIAARNLITITGGPFYPLLLGRKDSTTSSISHPNSHLLPLPNMPMSDIISVFSRKNLTVKDMVALTGAHTIGFSHCKEFSGRIYGYSEENEYDPRYNKVYAMGLRRLCQNYTRDASMSAFNDVMTPGKFDNMYYVNLRRGLGLLESDQGMVEDERTRGYVYMFADNETAFFEAFVEAMGKMSVYGVKTGSLGEVRRRCDAFNTIPTSF